MKVYLVNESVGGSDAVVKVFAKREDADKFAEKLLAELQADIDIEFDFDGPFDGGFDVYVVEMEVE